MDPRGIELAVQALHAQDRGEEPTEEGAIMLGSLATAVGLGATVIGGLLRALAAAAPKIGVMSVTAAKLAPYAATAATWGSRSLKAGATLLVIGEIYDAFERAGMSKAKAAIMTASTYYGLTQMPDKDGPQRPEVRLFRGGQELNAIETAAFLLTTKGRIPGGDYDITADFGRGKPVLTIVSRSTGAVVATLSGEVSATGGIQWQED